MSLTLRSLLRPLIKLLMLLQQRMARSHLQHLRTARQPQTLVCQPRRPGSSQTGGQGGAAPRAHQRIHLERPG